MTPRVLIALSLLVGVAGAAEDPRVLEIRREHDRIRSALSGAKLESVRLDDRSTDGGAATAWRDATGRIAYLRVELLGESGKRFEELFFVEGQLRFAFRQTHRYNVPYYVTPTQAKEMGTEPFDARKTEVLEDRFYFQGGRMFRWVDGRKQRVDPRGPDFAAAEAELLALGAEVASLFPSPAVAPLPRGSR